MMPVFFLSVPFVSVVMHITHENPNENQAEPLLKKRVTSRRNDDSVRLERRAECRTDLQVPFRPPFAKRDRGSRLSCVVLRVCQFRKVLGPDPAHKVIGVVLVFG